FDRFDRIYVMDLSNLKKVQAMARNEEDLAKVDLLMNEVQPGSDIEVPDPYFGGDEGFEHVFGLLNSAADAILKKYGGE
ncbi:MAG: low molecular weight phosphotyrosine protein phosphatase, partial [Bacteroidota bacterium]|nr:low molecular weight phosphotyrosine protein phosphatase [Bacteroidota bacterium]